jgi:hypothetical protein
MLGGLPLPERIDVITTGELASTGHLKEILLVRRSRSEEAELAAPGSLEPMPIIAIGGGCRHGIDPFSLSESCVKLPMVLHRLLVRGVQTEIMKVFSTYNG